MPSEQIKISQVEYGKLIQFETLLKESGEDFGFKNCHSGERVQWGRGKIPSRKMNVTQTEYFEKDKKPFSCIIGLYSFPKQKEGKITLISYSGYLFKTAINKIEELSGLEISCREPCFETIDIS